MLPKQVIFQIGFLLSLSPFAAIFPIGGAFAQLPRIPTGYPQGSTLPQAAYTLGSGDLLQIEIFNIPEYSGEYQVAIDGTIDLPEIGRLNLQDLTLAEANQLISRRYQRYIRRPRINVRLVAARPVTVAIAGEVNHPGSYTIALETTKNGSFPTLTEAIELAGGITRAAEVRTVQIQRTYRGQGQTLTVNLWDLLTQGDLSQDLPLRDGDRIILATQDRIDPNETRQLADASFAGDLAEPLKVVVVGEVLRPGSHALNLQNNQKETPTVTQAIALAGGITSLADIRNIEVRRLTRTGEENMIAVNLWELLQSGAVEEDLVLQEGDTIVVPTATNPDPAESGVLATASFAPETIQVYVVGEVGEPGIVEVAPNTALNQALLAAGGFTSRADYGDVELVRLNPNGTVSKREIRINFEQGINEEDNPPLRQNDVIVVERSGLAQFADTVGEALSPLRDFLPVISILRLFGR